MSSLSATQADGYYLPPEYYDSGTYKKKSKNQFAGSKGHNQYEQNGVVRFELPYKGICQGCMTSIGRGTRYNAKKNKTEDSYFTTPIWEFVMTCRTAGCQQIFRIRTNPQQRGFDFVSGITIQKGQEDDEYDIKSSSSAAEHPSTTTMEPRSALDRLESVACGKRKTMTELDQLKALQKLNQHTSLQDADSNAKIRAVFRKDRKGKKLRLEQGATKGWSKGVELLAPTVDDAVAARQTIFGKTGRQAEREKFANVRKSSIFAPSSSASTAKSRKKKRVIATPVTSGAVGGGGGSRRGGIRDGESSIVLPPVVVHSNTSVDLTATTEPRRHPETVQSLHSQTPTRDDELPDSSRASATNAPMSSLQAMFSAYGSDSD